jgi:DeoR/GlpR family transcriptional regulator of sugar metabolism
MSYAEERYNKILELLSQNGRVDAIELMTILNTSRETVRRDLNCLSKKGLLVKTHGGAIAPKNNTFEIFRPLKDRENSYQLEKQALCRYAAKAINEHDTIFLDNSTTITRIINYIPKQYNLTVITNSISLLSQFFMLHNPNWNIIALGGTLDYKTYSTNRYFAINNLYNFKPNKSFISCHGIDDDFSVTDTNMDDVEIKRYIVDACKETFLLADYSKIQRKGVVKIADASMFHSIITNDNIDSTFLSNLTAHGCVVQLAPTKNK